MLDNQDRQALGKALSIDPARVEAAVCRAVGRTFFPTGDPYWRLSNELETWRRGGQRGLPPFTALLFTLSHAAEKMESDGEFSHTNYYLRLAEVTGADRGRLSLHGKSTWQFWHAFSAWLAATNYAHGRPTARQMGSQRYVSLAISQAIVRAEDRQCFHHLFQKFGFTSSDEVSIDEMSQYIASWIPGNGANRRLKAAWNKPELRSRVCEVALAELREWQGEDFDATTGKATTSARLSMAAALIPGFPKRKLSLAIGRRSQGEEAIELASADGRDFILENSVYGGFATLSAPQGLQVQEVMSKGLALAAEGDLHRMSWRPRLVIPFARSQAGPFWSEVARASIGTEHLVLVRDEAPVRNDVNALLSEIAIPGFTCAPAPTIAGLPAGWLLYEGVQLLRAPAQQPRHAIDLAPLAQGGGIRIEGGLSIAPGVWHRRAAPSVRFDAPGAGGELSVHDGIDETGKVFASKQAVNGSAFIDLSAVDLPASGDIFLRGALGKAEQAASLLVRSARRPRPLDRRGLGKLSWTTPDTAGDASVAPDGETSVSGLVVSGPGLPPLAPDADETPLLAAGGEEEPEEAFVDEGGEPPPRRAIVTSPERAAELAATMSCSERAHHWHEADYVPPEAPKGIPVALTCRDCGHAYLREGGARRKESPSSATPAGKPAAPLVPSPSTAVARPVTRVDLDLLMDALSFMGSGSWASFEALVANEIDQPWEAAALADGLSALGHLDVRRNQGDGRIRSWCVPAPAIGLTPQGNGLLAGFRNEPMLAGLAGRLEAAGGELTVEPLAGQPAMVTAKGLSPDALEAALAGLVDPHGRPVAVIPDAPTQLASACIALQGNALLQPATLGRVAGVERFDLERNRWRESPVDGPGAYRVRSGAISYYFRDAGGSAFRGPHQAVKLLAARAAGHRLHAFDAASGRFESVIGCEPTGLVARALAMCSGKLPSISGHHLVHEQVDPLVGAAAVNLMYPGATP